jgi:hypothetical protein
MYANTFGPLGTYASQTLPSLLGLYNWASNLATGGNVAQADWSPAKTGTLDLANAQTFAPFTGTGGSNPMLPGGGGGGGGGSGQSALLGPFLSGAEGGIGAETNLAEQFANLTNGGANIYNQGQNVFNQGTNVFGQGQNILGMGNQMVNQARNKGLFPSQQAMIDQAVASQQAALQQQLGTEGLGSSTVAQQLKGQVQMSGAAAAGQLIQGNIQLGEAEQGIGLQGEQLGFQGEQLGFQGEQLGTQVNQALYSEFAGIASQNAALQAQTWQEAMQGMGAYGTMLNATLQPFGYAMKTQEDVLQANETEAGLQLQAQTGAAQASQAGFSSMMGGLGSLLGQGGLGSLFGAGATGSGAAAGTGLSGSMWGGSTIGSILGSSGIGTAGGAGAAGGLGGALGGIGSAIGGAGSSVIGAIGVLFSVFCRVAMTVYGPEDPRWILFREYLFFRAPKPLRLLYVKNAFWFSGYIKNRSWTKKVLKWVMDVLIWYDKATRTI